MKQERILYKHIKGESNIKENTIRTIRNHQNHYKTKKDLTKGDW